MKAFNEDGLKNVSKVDGRLLKVTESALQKIKNLMQKELDKPYLRIGIMGGGCNGLSYKMKFCDKGRDGDLMIEHEGVIVLVDSKTALYLKGTELDYEHKLIGGGFRYRNPNAKTKCSCGESFSV
jgi:iron-sulfur cluster assembly protein